MARIVDELIVADNFALLLMSILRGAELQNTLVDESALPSTDPDQLAGPFAHIIVDRPRSSPTRSCRCYCAAAPHAASPSSATAPRPGTGSTSRGKNASSTSGSATSPWPR